MKFTIIAALAICGSAMAQNNVGKVKDTLESALMLKLDTYWHSGKYEECITVLRALTAAKPEDAELSSNLVFMLGNVGRNDEAVQQSIKFNRAYPKNLRGAEDLAALYMRHKLYSRVPAVMEPVLEQASGLADFVMLGKSYEELGLVAESLRVWQIRLKKFPDDPTTKARVNRLKSLIDKR